VSDTSHNPQPFAGWKRMRLFAAVMLVAFGFLVFRLVDLQAMHHEKFQALVQQQRTSVVVLPARPGDIYDCKGHLLATSIQVDSLYADPLMVSDPRGLARKLATVIDVDPVQLERTLLAKADKRFIWIRRRIDARARMAIKALRLPRRAIGFVKEYKRTYPQGRLACHVIGIRDIDNMGRDGVERGWNQYLRGTDGRRVSIRDAHGKVLRIKHHESSEPIHGRTVVTTLDMAIQHFAEEGLDDVMAKWKPTSATAIVIEAQTGAVLAMGNRPTFDPDNIAGSPTDAWRNRALTDFYEPGSTAKPFTASVALDRGLVRFDEVIFCEQGVYRMGGRLLHDHHPFGKLTFPMVVIKSSNIGMAKLGERLGNPGLYEVVTSFGFGRPTGIGLPGEVSGVVLPLARWTSYSTGSIPMGQELTVTPIQMAAAYCALGSNGTLLKPRVVREVRDRDGRTLVDTSRPVVLGQPIAAKTARRMVREVLAGVVNKGTGRKAKLDNWQVWGKTGTAQKRDPDGPGYSHKLHVASFIGGAPAERPRLICLMMINEPSNRGTHYGGKLAGPAVAQILKKSLSYLNVPSDRADVAQTD